MENNDMEKNQSSLDFEDQELSVFNQDKSEKNIIVAGDHTVNGSIEGAVISGLNAYKQIKKLK